MLCYQSWHDMNQDLIPVMLPILTYDKTWVESSIKELDVWWKLSKYAYFYKNNHRWSNSILVQFSTLSLFQYWRWICFLRIFSKLDCLVQLKLFHQKVHIILLQNLMRLQWLEWLHRGLKWKKCMRNHE